MFDSLFIAGNGFDLAVGSKTRYEDFYNCLKDAYQLDLSSFKNSYIHSDNEIFIESFYNIVHKNMDNYFINYFLQYNRIFQSWVDFENELTNIIVMFDSLVFYLHNSNLCSLYFTNDNIDLYLKIFDNPKMISMLTLVSNNKYFTVPSNVKEALKYDGEKGLYFRINGFKGSTYQEVYHTIDKFSEETPKRLYDDLTIVSNLFSIYLAIVNHYVQLDARFKDLFECTIFINYNFTTYLDSIIENNNIRYDDILHINGSAANINGKPLDKIVFGIDSSTKLKNYQFDIFTKNTQRSFKNTDIARFNKLNDYDFANIYIFGLSLSLADFETLHIVLGKNYPQDCEPEIYIYYYDAKSKLDLIMNAKKILGVNKFDFYQRNNHLHFIECKEAFE